MSYEVIVLSDGYSEVLDDIMKANCSCTLIKGANNIIVDTMTAWDKDIIIAGLRDNGLTPDDIDYVVCTHGHSDHIGNNNLFLQAHHIVGFSVSKKDEYEFISFSDGQELIIDDYIKIIPTPGHTMQDVTVIVDEGDQVTAITGDLFEHEDDIEDQTLWMSAGSDNPELQKTNRKKIIDMADRIIPGHGPMFYVTQDMRDVIDFQNMPDPVL